MEPGLLVVAALSGLLELSDRSEVRLRDPGTFTNTASLDLETALTARLTLHSRRARIVFSYAPRLTLWDANVSPTGTLMQAASVRAEWHDRLARWWIAQAGSYGGIDTAVASLMPTGEQAQPRVDALPTPQIFQFASSTTTLGTEVAWRRWLFAWTLGYQLSGGADAQAQAVLPLEFGPFARARLDLRASRRTHFITRVSAAEATFTSGPESVVVEATQALRLAWSRGVATELALGASEVRVRMGSGDVDAYTTYPVAQALLEQQRARRGDHFTVRVTARIAPIVNQLFGTVDERAQAMILASWTHRRVTLDLFGTAQQTVPPDYPYATQLVAGELHASYPTDSRSLITVDAGVRAVAERLSWAVAPGSNELTQTSFALGIVFVGFSVRAPPVRW